LDHQARDWWAQHFPQVEAQLLAFHTRFSAQIPGLVILDRLPLAWTLLPKQLIERAIDQLLKNATGHHHRHRLGTIHRTQRDHDSRGRAAW